LLGIKKYMCLAFYKHNFKMLTLVQSIILNIIKKIKFVIVIIVIVKTPRKFLKKTQ